MRSLIALLALIVIAALYVLSQGGSPTAVPQSATVTPSTGAVFDTELPASTTRATPVDGNDARRAVESRGAIVGRVVDPTMRPLVAARVVFETKRNFVGPNILAHPVGSSSRLAELEWVETNEDGAFEVSAVERGQVIVTAAGHHGTSVRAPATAGRSFDVGDVVLEVGGQISGRVVDPGGAPVAGAAVFVAKRDRALVPRPRMHAVRTLDDGRFALVVDDSRDQLTLIGEHPDHAPGRSRCPAPGPLEQFDQVVIRLGASVSIDGIVTGLNERAAREPIFVHTRSKRDRADPPIRFSKHRGRVDTAGRFELRGLARDVDYTLRVHAGEEEHTARPLGPATVVASGSTGVEVAVLPEVTVRFRVRSESEDTAPIRVVRAFAALEHRGQHAFGGLPLIGRPHQISTNADGGFEMTVQPTEAGMKLALGVAADGFAPGFRIGLAMPDDGILEAGEFSLEPRPMLRVRVTNAADDEPVANATVFLQRSDYESRSTTPVNIDTAEDAVRLAIEPTGDSAGGRSDEHGLAIVTLDQTGTACDVRVRHPQFADTELRSIEMPAIDEVIEVSARLVTGATARVVVVDADGRPVGGAHVACSPADRTSRVRNLETDAAGVVVFQRVAAGDHAFTVTRARGARQMSLALSRAVGGEGVEGETSRLVQVTSRGITDVRLVQHPPAVVEGIVRLDGVPLAGAKITTVVEVGHRASAKTDEQGAYSITGVAPGSRTLRVWHSRLALAAELAFEAERGLNDVNPRIETGRIVGRVVDVHGLPIRGMSVGVRTLEAPRLKFGLGDPRSVSDGDGQFEIDGVVTGVPVVVDACSFDYVATSSNPMTIAPGTTTGGLVVVLPRAGRLRVKFEGRSEGFTKVRATHQQSKPPIEMDASVSVFGASIDLVGLAPGTWEVAFLFGGDGPPQTIAVVAGEMATVTLRR